MSDLTRKEKIELFRLTAVSPKARAEYAKSRAEVILPLIETQSTVRNVFKPETLPPGAEARYDIPFDDIDCAWVMPQIGGVPQVMVEGTEIHVGTFGIDAQVSYKLDAARQGRFQVGENSTALLRNKMIALEELAGWTLIKAHAGTLGSDQQVSGSALNLDTFNDIVTKGDVLQRSITDLFVSPTRYGNLRSWVSNAAYSDGVKDKALSMAGMSNVWDVNVHKVYSTDLVANNKGYAFGQRDGFYYGVMPIRQEMETFDNPVAMLEWKIGIMAREVAGFGVLDDKGLIEVTFTS